MSSGHAGAVGMKIKGFDGAKRVESVVDNRKIIIKRARKKKKKDEDKWW